MIHYNEQKCVKMFSFFFVACFLFTLTRMNMFRVTPEATSDIFFFFFFETRSCHWTIQLSTFQNVKLTINL